MPAAMAVDHQLGEGDSMKCAGRRRRGGYEGNQRPKKRNKMKRKKKIEEAGKKNRFDRYGFPFT